MAATAPRSLHQLPCSKADHDEAAFSAPARLPQSVSQNTSCFKGCNRWQQPHLAACISFLAERLIMTTLSLTKTCTVAAICASKKRFLLQRVQEMAASQLALAFLPYHDDSVFQRPARLPQSVAERLNMKMLPSQNLHGCRNLGIPKHFLLQRCTDGSNCASQLASASLPKD